MQPNIFDTAKGKPQQKNGLAITVPGKQILTKQQKDFNRLVKKIEKLRAELERNTTVLDKNIEYYVANIHPLEERLVVLRSAAIKVFFPYYTGEKKFLTKDEKNTLHEIISGALDEIFYLIRKDPDEELKTIYKVIKGESFDDMKKDAFDEMKEELEDKFRDAGFDINLDDMNENMSEEEMMMRLKEMQEEFARQAEELGAKDATRKKTKKQLQQEEREKQIEEARKKSIGSIYKELAKAFHPDLEPDHDKKLEKEVIMKQLTVAYEKNDLHTLLKLEMEWIQKETNDPGKLSNDKLAIYNEALKEQVMELEMQIDVLETHQRYAQLHRFADYPSELTTNDLATEKRRLAANISSLEYEQDDFKGPNALHHLKDLIRAYKQHTSGDDELEAMMKEFMKMMK